MSPIVLVLVAVVAGIALIPYIPDGTLEILDHPMFRVFLIVAVLLAIRTSALVGVGALLIIGALLIQRNYRKMKGIVYVKNEESSIPRMKEDEDMPVSPSIKYVEASEPDREVFYFAPQADTGSDEFTPAPGAVSIDYKRIF